MFSAAADSGNADEIIGGENGVVEGEEGGALPLGEGIGEEGVGGVGAAVQAEADGGGGGVVGILNQFLEDGRAFGVVY